MDFAKLFSLEGRVAVVTGGSRGIGRMIAEGFIAAGCARVYITARKAAVVEETAAELGPNCIALPGDISTYAGIEALAEDLAQRESHIDILVNNAGVAWGAEFDDFPEMGWDKVMNLNVKTPFFLTQKLHGLLKAAAGEHPAKVINIASVDGLRVNPWETYSYQASKSALVHLTRRMAARLVKDNIIVNVKSGFVDDITHTE
jgi:NAD(P)-dependent dehydrogenase (short-subunit alcohol dehydrogenase family)